MRVGGHRSIVRAGMVCVVAMCATAAVGEGLDIPAKHLGWGRFQSGAWQTARVVTETIDEQGKVVGTTTTDRRTELVRVRRNTVTLRVAASVSICGKRFDTPIQTIVRGPHGENIVGRVRVESLADEVTLINGRKIPCRVYRYRIPQDEQEKVVKVFYSPRISPYIFRRESVTLLGQGRKTTDQSSAKVIAVAQPYTVINETVQTSHVQIEKKTDKGSTVTVAIHAPDIPGEVVAYTSEERDATGLLVRRSRMELVDYDFQTADKSSGNDQRRPPRRVRRRSRRDK